MEQEEKSYTKMARVLVEEINNVDRLDSMFELGVRLQDAIGTGLVASFGFGCGSGCDSFGFGCGNKCGGDIPWTEERIRSRWAIDVLGNRGLTAKDMEAISNLPRIQTATVKVIEEKLSLDNMRSRIAKYSKK